jgi:uncharacterized BrkB/YihY/UPF0761 family membrane protein
MTNHAEIQEAPVLKAGEVEMGAADLEIFHRHEDRKQNRDLRGFTLKSLIWIFTLSNVFTLYLYWLVATKRAFLSDRALGQLVAATTAEVAGLLFVSIRYLFPSQQGTYEPKRKHKET